MKRYLLAAFLGSLLYSMWSYTLLKRDLDHLHATYDPLVKKMIATYDSRQNNWYTVSEFKEFRDRAYEMLRLYDEGKALANLLWWQSYLPCHACYGVFGGYLLVFAWDCRKKLAHAHD